MEAVMASHPIGTLNPFRRINLNLRSAIAAIVVAGMMTVMAGCTTEDSKAAAQQIATAIPQVTPFITTAQAIVDTLDPMAAPVVDAGVLAVNLGLGVLQSALQTYASSPSATAWGAIVDAVTNLVNKNGSTILALANITDPTSKARALVVMGGIQSALMLILAIVQRVHDGVTSAKLAAAAQVAPVKISEYRQYIDRHLIETATGHSLYTAIAYETSQGF